MYQQQQRIHFQVGEKSKDSEEKWNIIEEVIGFKDGDSHEKEFTFPGIANTSQGTNINFENLHSEDFGWNINGSWQDNVENGCFSKALPNNERYCNKDQRTSDEKEIQRKANHNRDERKRRNFINRKIEELEAQLPKSDRKRSKGRIVDDAVVYIEKLKADLDKIITTDVGVENLQNSKRPRPPITGEMEETQKKHDRMHMGTNVLQLSNNMVALLSAENPQIQTQQCSGKYCMMMPPRGIALQSQQENNHLFRSTTNTVHNCQCNLPMAQPQRVDLNGSTNMVYVGAAHLQTGYPDFTPQDQFGSSVNVIATQSSILPPPQSSNLHMTLHGLEGNQKPDYSNTMYQD